MGNFIEAVREAGRWRSRDREAKVEASKRGEAIERDENEALFPSPQLWLVVSVGTKMCSKMSYHTQSVISFHASGVCCSGLAWSHGLQHR